MNSKESYETCEVEYEWQDLGKEEGCKLKLLKYLTDICSKFVEKRPTFEDGIRDVLEKSLKAVDKTKSVETISRQGVFGMAYETYSRYDEDCRAYAEKQERLSSVNQEIVWMEMAITLLSSHRLSSRVNADAKSSAATPTDRLANNRRLYAEAGKFLETLFGPDARLFAEVHHKKTAGDPNLYAAVTKAAKDIVDDYVDWYSFRGCVRDPIRSLIRKAEGGSFDEYRRKAPYTRSESAACIVSAAPIVQDIADYLRHTRSKKALSWLRKASFEPSEPTMSLSERYSMRRPADISAERWSAELLVRLTAQVCARLQEAALTGITSRVDYLVTKELNYPDNKWNVAELDAHGVTKEDFFERVYTDESDAARDCLARKIEELHSYLQSNSSV